MLKHFKFLHFIPDPILDKLEKLLIAIIILVVTRVLVAVLRYIFFDRVGHPEKPPPPKKNLLAFDKALLPILRGTMSVGIWTIGIMASLETLGIISKTSFVALIGSLGLGAGFAIKDLVSNTIAGISLLVSRPFELGDYIDINNDGVVIGGTVKEVSILNTKLESIDGLFVAMPNSIMYTNPIINYTRNKKRRFVANLSLSYKEPLESVIGVLQNIVNNEPRFLKDPAPSIVVSDMKESNIQLQLRGWTTTADYWDTYYDVMRKIKDMSIAAGVELPAAQRHLPIITHVVTDNILPAAAQNTNMTKT